MVENTLLTTFKNSNQCNFLTREDIQLILGRKNAQDVGASNSMQHSPGIHGSGTEHSTFTLYRLLHDPLELECRPPPKIS